MVRNIFEMREYKGLGDVVKRVAEATRMDKVATFVAKKMGYNDCGCNAKADKLNEWVPFKRRKV